MHDATFERWLKDAVHEAGKRGGPSSVRAAADAAGVARATIYQAFRGARVSAETVAKLASALGVEPWSPPPTEWPSFAVELTGRATVGDTPAARLDTARSAIKRVDEALGSLEASLRDLRLLRGWLEGDATGLDAASDAADSGADARQDQEAEGEDRPDTAQG